MDILKYTLCVVFFAIVLYSVPIRSSDPCGQVTGCNSTGSTCCTTCTQISGCIWCQEELTCTEGNWAGAYNNVTCTKSKAYYKTCKIPSLTLIILISAAAGLVLVLCVALICFCFICRRCRKWQRKRSEREDAEDNEKLRLLAERKERLREGTPIGSGSSTTDAIRAKWNLKSNH